MRIGVTGHQRLAEPEAWDWVRSQIDMILEHAASPLIGISSLAIGADQMFAESVLGHGGVLEVVIPFPEYEERFTTEREREVYRWLLKHAARRIVLDRAGSDEESYCAAGWLIVDSADLLIAVWDGVPAKGLGGTGDVVRYAEQTGKPVVHIDPIKRRVEARP